MSATKKQVILLPESAERLASGVRTVYEAVSATFGARSGNVAIKRPYGPPSVLHDGVSIAREVIPLEDDIASVGAELVVEAATQTDKLGDGTTAATILTYEMYTEARKRIAAGYQPMAIREGVELAVNRVVEQIEAATIPITVDDIEKVTAISAQVPELGRLVAEGLKAVGEHGVVTVDESRTGESYLEIKQGMEFAEGYRSPYFVTDDRLREAVIEDAAILVTNHKLDNMADFAPAIEAWASENIKNYVIIADDITDQVLAFLVLNHVQKNIQVIAVKAPFHGERRDAFLKDIATVTGATFIDKEAGMTIAATTAHELGRAKRVVASKDATVIVEGGGAKEDIDTRIDELSELLKAPETDLFDHELTAERLAKLSGGIAVINVGAKGETELKERKERVIDAIAAGKAALSSGIVPGGGVTLLSARAALDGLYREAHPDIQAGIMVVHKALSAPFKKLMHNAGYEPGEKMTEVARSRVENAGIEVVSGKLLNMVEAGIIDPMAVVRASLQNAASQAMMLATSNVVIVDAPEKE